MAHYITAGNYKLAKHLNLINEKLLDVFAGRTKRLIINMPPQHGKSELISRYFPMWYLGHRPDHKIILVSYQGDYAASWGKKARNVFKEYGGKLFGLKVEGVGSASEWGIMGHDGGMKTSGVDGSVTGRAANIMIIDDPHKNEKEALSKLKREQAWDFFRATAYTRLAQDGAIIIIMTRWHYDDLTGRILKEELDNWEVLSLPAVAKDNDPMGRQAGEALWEYKHSIESLHDKKKTMGSYWFSAEYQQEPIATEYQIFKPEWWNFYTETPNCPYVIQVWDTAFKNGQENDYSVCATWGVCDKKLYLLDLWRGKPIFPDLLRLVVTQYNMHKPRVILIEDAASGQDLIPVLRRDTHLPIRGVKAIGKEIRAHIVSPIVESRKIFLPESALWLVDFINEHSEFPHGQHDDIVDTTTMAIQTLSSLVNSAQKTITKAAVKKEKKIRNNKFSNY